MNLTHTHIRYRSRTSLRLLFGILAGFFCFCYPFAVIGVAFDVNPPFSFDWAGSFLLFLEGSLLIVAAMFRYGYWRPLLAGACVVVFSYLIETLGVHTGFPFGTYRYTSILLPRLPGGVPFAVMFAWVLIVFGGYGSCQGVKRPLFMRREIAVGTALLKALLAALLAVLLDLAIEPVAAHVVLYWGWAAPGSFSYYGVPLANFVAWFVIAFVLLILVDVIVQGTNGRVHAQYKPRGWKNVQRMERVERLAMFVPRLLFLCSLFMFGLIDFTHGYYWGAILALIAGILIYLLSKNRHTLL